MYLDGATQKVPPSPDLVLQAMNCMSFSFEVLTVLKLTADALFCSIVMRKSSGPPASVKARTIFSSITASRSHPLEGKRREWERNLVGHTCKSPEDRLHCMKGPLLLQRSSSSEPGRDIVDRMSLCESFKRIAQRHTLRQVSSLSEK